MILNEPEMLLKLHEQLVDISSEIDDDEVVPERYGSTLAAIVAENDSHILIAASKVLHRLHLNSKYPRLNALQANYVKFNQEVTSA